jgi:FixJ family two-component response regulator
MESGRRVFVVDDEAVVLKAVERMLRSNGFAVEAFATAEALLERLPYDGIACVLIDLRMPGVSGLELQDVMSRRGLTMPIIFLSAHGDVPSTARAMREGAIDFLEKPVEEPLLLEAIERALARAGELYEQRRAEHDTEARLARLTKREREVGELVARGLLNKQIAFELGTSEKTVKVHRGRVMRKLRVESVPDLVRLLERRPPSRR